MGEIKSYMRQKTYLDLNKVDVYGWFSAVKESDVAHYMTEIENNDKTNPINLFKIDDGTYQLVKHIPGNDDMQNQVYNHAKAFAYFQLGKEMPCNIVSTISEIDFGINRQEVNIRDIVLNGHSFETLD